ncbi:dnaJ homolog subfamily C member 30, mitochondrial-like isoform X2 [Penaeus monodon]|uniref:dnaJ homolog subfamily C member 30, mitochondrial-like isoform X2 n=1 Tax=Penaeus monodon TaxID=6687 RepID=UPI0018A788C0|nr:dnaJ homolog subfamily C member 30, mitochondrial-like isoform X2 [Penaeus monodon]
MTPLICRTEVKSALNSFARSSLTRALLENSRPLLISGVSGIGLYSRRIPGVSGIGLYPGTPNSQQKAWISSTPKERSYYDILQITPKATQSQVKKAYYKLSKTYHPDQYRGTEDAALKFREITEAYEILGNLKKRRMYDKGLLNMNIAASPAEAEEYSSKFYESRSKRGKAPTATGRTPIYDFDEWSKLHYESSFARRENAKERYERLQKARTDIVEEKKSESVVYILIVAIVLYCMKISFSTPVHDKVKEK